MSDTELLKNLYKGELEPYWFENGGEVLGLDNCISSVPKGKSFIFLTDPHRREGLGNRMRSPALIGYIMAETGIKTTLLGGDYIGRLPYREMAEKEIESYLLEMSSVCGDGMLVAFGNHDRNTANAPPEAIGQYMIPYERLDSILFGRVKDRELEDVSERLEKLDCSDEIKRELMFHSRMHYFVDDKELKIRYILLDTGVRKAGDIAFLTYGVAQMDMIYMQFDWLYGVLCSAPEGYDVVIFGHYLYSWTEKHLSAAAVELCKMISGFKTASKVSVNTGYSAEHKLEKFYKSGDHVYDFTGRKASGTAVILGGDTHWDTWEVADYGKNGEFTASAYHGEKLSKTAVVVSGLQSDAYGCVNYYENAVRMEPGTRTEQCFDIVTILPDGNVKMTRVGAGKSRFIRTV